MPPRESTIGIMANAISNLEKNHEDVWIVTQNIDGMHQRAGSKNIVELHGSAWRLRCDHCKIIIEDHNPKHYNSWKCDNETDCNDNSDEKGCGM